MSRSEAGESANELRLAGNRLFSCRKFDDAINSYTRAIAKGPLAASLYTNRALCHLKLKNWLSAVEDCRRALELDVSLVKAHFYLGQALFELKQHNDALPCFQKAHELAKQQRLNFGDDITAALRMIRRRRLAVMEETQTRREEDLGNYLMRLIVQDKDAQMERVRQEWEQSGSDASSAPAGAGPSNQKLLAGPSSGVTSLQQQLQAIDDEAEKRLDDLNQLLQANFKQRRHRDVPDYMCGRISFELMRDPVITPSGITYDRSDIMEHLQRVGHFDPVTMVPLEQSQLISNLAMKEVVDNYLEENPWAEDY